MTTSFQSEKKIFIQEGQSPAEQRFDFNLMINVMSRNTDTEKRSKRDLNVHKVTDYADKHVAQQRTIDHTVGSME
jgi:hypothetical protein